MATCSITDPIVITDPVQAELFANAIEEAAMTPLRHPQIPAVFVNDREELKELMRRRKELHG